MDVKPQRDSSFFSSGKEESVSNKYGAKEDFFNEASSNEASSKDEYDSEIDSRATRSPATRFSVFGIFRAIIDKLSDMIDSIKRWVQKHISKIRGTYREEACIEGIYREGSIERDSVEKWESFYSDFRSQKTQEQIYRVQGEHPQYKRPYLELINRFMEDIDIAIHDIQKQDVSNGKGNQAICGPWKRLVRAFITSIPEEIVRKCNDETDPELAEIVSIINPLDCDLMLLERFIGTLNDMKEGPGDESKSANMGEQIMGFVKLYECPGVDLIDEYRPKD